MNVKVGRRHIDGLDLLTLLVPIILLAPFLVLITIVCLVGAVMDSFNQRGYLRGRKVTGTISAPGNENERTRGLTSKEEGTTYNDINRQILAS